MQAGRLQRELERMEAKRDRARDDARRSGLWDVSTGPCLHCEDGSGGCRVIMDSPRSYCVILDWPA